MRLAGVFHLSACKYHEGVVLKLWQGESSSSNLCLFCYQSLCCLRYFLMRKRYESSRISWVPRCGLFMFGQYLKRSRAKSCVLRQRFHATYTHWGYSKLWSMSRWSQAYFNSVYSLIFGVYFWWVPSLIWAAHLVQNSKLKWVLFWHQHTPIVSNWGTVRTCLFQFWEPWEHRSPVASWWGP